MTDEPTRLILGEFRRSLDERYRISIPLELLDRWGSDSLEIVLAKERPGCLSLWRSSDWQIQVDAGMRVLEAKLSAGRLGDRLTQVQTLGRLVSTRHRPVPLAARGRLVIPEGFREFLGAEPGGEVLVVGAAVCIEIWRPDAWLECLNNEIPRFGQLLEDLTQ
jgi:MraZ protein